MIGKKAIRVIEIEGDPQWVDRTLSKSITGEIYLGGKGVIREISRTVGNVEIDKYTPEKSRYRRIDPRVWYDSEFNVIDDFGLLNKTIRLRSGLYFDLVNPKPEQFTVEDIAGALSKICRFGGQIGDFYSVAEHCVHCAGQALDDGRDYSVALHALFHDAAEAFIGDVVKPLKVMLPEYEMIERRIESVIFEKFSIDPQHAELVKEIDRAMLIAERNRFFTRDNSKWTGEDSVRKLSPDFGPLPPNKAELSFMAMAAALLRAAATSKFPTSFRNH